MLLLLLLRDGCGGGGGCGGEGGSGGEGVYSKMARGGRGYRRKVITLSTGLFLDDEA